MTAIVKHPMAETLAPSFEGEELRVELLRLGKIRNTGYRTPDLSFLFIDEDGKEKTMPRCKLVSVQLLDGSVFFEVYIDGTSCCTCNQKEFYYSPDGNMQIESRRQVLKMVVGYPDYRGNTKVA